MRRVLVTGGAGFIGSHVVDELFARGHHVTVLDDLSGGFVENVHPNVRLVAGLVRGSITNTLLVNSLCAEGRFDAIYHLAAYAAENLSHHIKRFNYRNNLLGSVNLINAAINYGVPHFVFTSSIAVYGIPARLPVREDDPCTPIDSYGIAKLAVEQELRISHEMFGLDYTIFRPHNVYGPRQNTGDPYRNVIGIFMRQAMEGEPFTVFGDGTQVRAFTDVRDVAPLIAAAPDVPGARNQTFNVGGDAVVSVNFLAELVAGLMGVPLRIKYLPARHEAPVIYSSHDKARDVFGPRTHTLLWEGLERMAQWVKGHGVRASQPFGAIEVHKNLPKVWLDGVGK